MSTLLANKHGHTPPVLRAPQSSPPAATSADAFPPPALLTTALAFGAGRSLLLEPQSLGHWLWWEAPSPGQPLVTAVGQGRCCLHQSLLMNVAHPSSFPVPTLDIYLLFWLRKGEGWAVAGFMVTVGLRDVTEVVLQRGWLCLVSLQNSTAVVVQPA